ncbi:DNA damage-binding protein 2 isoform X2 [Salmo trutta]|uniref:DNA damage-binding protein 2 isoform X2 n=1 Tax=Salmo trutta TaxID=8032 RepID=UPI0011315480|nr:DNA damage-binding protein 2-like isoform X2 [Salmo trutta]
MRQVHYIYQNTLGQSLHSQMRQVHYIYQSTLGQSLHSQMRQVHYIYQSTLGQSLHSQMRQVHYIYQSTLGQSLHSQMRQVHYIYQNTLGQSLHSQMRQVHYIYQSTLGQSLHSQMRQCLQKPYVRSLSSYKLHRTASPFDRRVTCLEWHPSLPTTLAVGSKGGDVVLWDYSVINKTSFIQGVGPGGSITALKFNPYNPTQLFTSSVRGTTTLQDFNGTTLRVFTNTESWEDPGVFTYCPWTLVINTGIGLFVFIMQKGAGDFIGGMTFSPTDPSKVYLASGDGTLTEQSFQGGPATVLSRVQDCGHDHHNVCLWYCCVDVSLSRQMLVTGDNIGRVLLLGMDGHQVFNEKLHKAKVTHAEFNPRCDWLMATASVDHTVKLWDLRNIKDKNSYLHEMVHDKAVNSAYFNPVDCSKLLTTDQYDQIRVYSSSDWSTPQQIIQHPHRQFQHLTPIKASWHPLYDLMVVGRYPDERVCPGALRTIDIYDANTGELACQLLDPNAPGIISVNKFNPMGDVLGSGMGVNILVWNRSETLAGKQQRGQQEAGVQVGRGRGQRRRRGEARRRGEGRGEDEDDIGKLKKKLSSSSTTRTRTSRDKQHNSQTRKGPDK